MILCELFHAYLTSATGYFQQTVSRYLLYEFEHHFRIDEKNIQILSGNKSSLRAVNSQNITWLAKQLHTCCNCT